MAKTSNKLYSIKNTSLQKNINDINVDNKNDLLLLQEPSEYNELYRKLNIKSKQDFVEEQMKDFTEINLIQSKYNNLETFKGSHIKKLCNTYHLKIKNIDEIKGYFNDEAMKYILEFSKKFENTIINDSNIYILAPVEYFYNVYKNKEVKTFILFYKDDSNDRGYRKVRENDNIIQLYSSGKDFSVFRKLYRFCLTTRYDTGDGTSFLTSNILLSLIFLFSITIGVFFPIMGLIIFIIYLIVFSINNSNINSGLKNYYNYWNDIPVMRAHVNKR